MHIDVLTQPTREYTYLPALFHLAPVVTNILDTGLRVRGEPMSAGGVWSIIEPRGADGHGNLVHPHPLGIQLITLTDDLLARSFIHHFGNNAAVYGMSPLGTQVLNRIDSKAGEIHVFVRSQGRNRHRDIVFLALGIGWLLKQPGTRPCGLRVLCLHDTASEPADESQYPC